MNPSTDSHDTHMDQKHHWRSIAHLENDPRVRELMEREFPEGTTELASSIDRRSFLGLMGASLALAGLTGCRRPEERIVPYVSKPEEITLGIPQQYATSMPLGTESFPLLVESHEGRPTKIMGNPQSATGTATLPWVSASILGLYDPDRSQHVRERGQQTFAGSFTAAWAGMRTALAASGGEGFALLVESYASPTMHRLLADFRTAYPRAQVAVWNPVNDENLLEGMRLATGSAVEPHYDYEKADVVLTLDADILGTETGALAASRGFAARRHVRSTKDTMNRLYVVEPSLTQTSGMADHRLAVASRMTGAFAAALVLALAEQGVVVPGVNLGDYAMHPFDRTWLAAAAKDLARTRGRSIVVAGRRQPPAVHALVAAINAALGNTGTIVQHVTRSHSTPAATASLVALTDAMKAGTVKTLVILGGNPVYTAPAALGFGTLLDGVATSVHLGAHVDETSERCTWHLPQAHYLEQWGDVSGSDGRLGIIQPLIAPLYDECRSDIEILSLLVTGTEAKGYDLVRTTWSALLPAAGFEGGFRTVLHDGLHAVPAQAASAPVNTAAVAAAIAAQPFPRNNPSASELEIVFALSPTLHDGRYANNGWLMEFPDPVTKLTWDNAAIMSRATAGELGLKNNDLVRMSLDGRDAVAPVFVMPGQAEGSITFTLGWGRRRAGRIGTNRGFNAYRLRTAEAADYAIGVTLTRVDSDYKLACVQDHHGLDEEKLAAEGVAERLPFIVREGTLEEYRKEPAFAKERVHLPPLKSMWDDHVYDKGHQWGMTIDLNACTGCGACTVACQSENNIPIVGKEQVLNGREMHWIRIDRYFSGEVDRPMVLVQPMACVHCEMAPCEQVCPVAATTHDEEGLNTMAYNRCIGTRYCANNCPYKVRRFNFFNFQKDMPETLQMAMNPEVSVRFRGVMEKCTYCTQRISLGRIAAKRDGRALADGDIATACEQACPTQAIVFGDINDPKSRVTEMKKNERDYALLGELNVRPRTTFLARLRNPNPDLEGRA